eukprot:scaffold23975_cov132-Cylindrotheca_fusiformis.AAC.4
MYCHVIYYLQAHNSRLRTVPFREYVGFGDGTRFHAVMVAAQSLNPKFVAYVVDRDITLHILMKKPTTIRQEQRRGATICVENKLNCIILHPFLHPRKIFAPPSQPTSTSKMDVFLKELLADKEDVIIVSDSAKIPCYCNTKSGRRFSSQYPLNRSFRRLSCPAPESRWECNEDSTVSTRKGGRNPTVSKSSEHITPLVSGSGKEQTTINDLSTLQDMNKAQRIIRLVESLAMRAVITIRGHRRKNSAPPS